MERMTTDILIIVPAAGASNRLGTCKQDIEIGQTTVWQKVVNATCHTGYPVTLVTGFWRPSENPPPNCTVIHNDRWQEGMGTSIALAVKESPTPLKGYCVLLCDQWGIEADSLSRFISQWDGACVQVAHDESYSGPPVLFPSDLKMLLAELTGDEGARQLMPALNPEKITLQNSAFDLDTYADIEHMLTYSADST
jgi:molybdenum cofactor cytidylyltransferase